MAVCGRLRFSCPFCRRPKTAKEIEVDGLIFIHIYVAIVVALAGE